MSRWITTVLVMSLVASAAFAGLWLHSESRLRQLQFEVRSPFDAPLERKAYQVKARSDRATVSEMERILFPVTVHFPDRACVELRPRRGVKGGSSISCFSNGTGKLLSHDDIGE
jgi:hypothetical protein